MDIGKELREICECDDSRRMKTYKTFKNLNQENNLEQLVYLIYCCCRYNSFDCLNLIIHTFNINEISDKIEQYYTPLSRINGPLLLHCCKSHSFECLKLLIEAGLDVNKTYQIYNSHLNHSSCLDYTCRRNMSNFIELLLLNGADHTILKNNSNVYNIKRNLLNAFNFIDPYINIYTFSGEVYHIIGWLFNYSKDFDLKRELCYQKRHLMNEYENFNLIFQTPQNDYQNQIVDVLTPEIKDEIFWNHKEHHYVILNWI